MQTQGLEADYSRPDYEQQGLKVLKDPVPDEYSLHPLRDTANRVGREVERFAEALDGYNPMRADDEAEKYDMAIELINVYHDTALRTLQRLRKHHSSRRQTREEHDDDADVNDLVEDVQQGLSTTIEDLERWGQEAHMWDLLKRLVHLRFPRPGSEKDDLPIPKPIHPYASERELWNSFLETDDLALERKTVVQWLKDTADESGEDIDILVQDLQQNAERGDIIAHGWLHTKSAIKNQKRIHSWPQPLDPTSPELQNAHLNSTKTQPLVTQLDPDAPFRQDRKLEAEDEYFERSIWLGCYELLRRGKSSSEIKEWCSERTEAWRAVSMSGFPDDVEGEQETSGNLASSALWRKMCFALARNSSGDEYQRAVYGLLSGDIQSVEPVCKSWDDFVFVHYNALLKSQFDLYLQNLPSQKTKVSSQLNLTAFDAVQFHGDPKSTGKRLIETLKIDPRTRSETLEPTKMLQGVLIANQFKHFIYQQGLALSKLANSKEPSNLIPRNKERPENEETTRYIQLNDYDGLRVLTHVLLIFMSLGMDLGGVSRETEVENVIVAYISFLRLAGREELIPLYSSQLSGARKYAVLSRNLIDVTNPERRMEQIKLMHDLGLDVQEFVRMQARYLLDDYQDTAPGYPATGNFKIFTQAQTSTGLGRRMRTGMLGGDDDALERVDMLLIRSLEWYLLVEGLWSETFTIGTILYLRFFSKLTATLKPSKTDHFTEHMNLLAARHLASRVSCEQITRRKTRALLGDSVGVAFLEADEEDLTEVLDGSSENKRLLKKYLLDEMKNFRELECLTEHLEYIESISRHTEAFEQQVPICRLICWTY